LPKGGRGGYDPIVRGRAEALAEELTKREGVDGLVWLHDRFEATHSGLDPGDDRTEANRQVAEIIAYHYCALLPAGRLHPALAYATQAKWSNRQVADRLVRMLSGKIEEGPPEYVVPTMQALELKRKGEYQEALAEDQKALAVAETYGFPLPAARTLIGMGSTLRRMSRLQEAETAYLKAKSILERTPHPDRDQATLNSNLALLYTDTKRYAEAFELTRGAMAIDRQRTADRPDLLAMDLINIVTLSTARGMFQDGAQVAEEALSFCCQEKLAKVGTCGAARRAVAGLVAAQGRDGEAEKLYLSAIEAYHEMVPTPVEGLAGTYEAYASLLNKTGRVAAARAATAKAASASSPWLK
jgi:tetratricopeptide (TPR) repeat protein